MIKVLEVVGKMDRAGQETFLMNVFRNINKDKYDVSFSVNTEYIGAYEEEIKSLGGKIFHNPYSVNTRNFRKYIKAFRKYIRENGPFDVVHCHVWLFGGFIMWAAKKENVPIRIMHSHSTGDKYSHSIFRTVYRKISKKLINKYATQKVACGKDAYSALFDVSCPNDDLILNNAIDIASFDEKNINLEAYKTELGLNFENFVIVSVARFCDVKNHKKIISIFTEIHKRIPEAVLLLVGDGELRKDIINQIENEKLTDSVKLLGVRNDVNKILLCSDIFLMPSKFEGLPVSLVEAQAAGVICMISDKITDEIDMGLELIYKLSIFDSDSKWAENIEKFKNSRKPLFEKRFEHISKKGYTISGTLKKLDLIYDKK